MERRLFDRTAYNRAMRTRSCALAVLSICLSGCSVFDEAPRMATRADCEDLRTIEAKLMVAAGGPTEKTPAVLAELARHKKNLSSLGGEEWLARCQNERTAASIECARGS